MQVFVSAHKLLSALESYQRRIRTHIESTETVERCLVIALSSFLFWDCLIRGSFGLTWTPGLRSRPKFASDQTFQTKIISDQTFQTAIISDQNFQTKIISDQTFQIKIISDQTFQTEWVLIRLSRPKEFWSDHLQTMVQTQIPTIAQTLIRLWSDPISDPSSLWSDSVETISPADNSGQKHSKSPWSALPSFNHNT